VIDGRERSWRRSRDGGFRGDRRPAGAARTATVRAKTLCDLFVLEKADFSRVLREQPQFTEKVNEGGERALSPGAGRGSANGPRMRRWVAVGKPALPLPFDRR